MDKVTGIRKNGVLFASSFHCCPVNKRTNPIGYVGIAKSDAPQEFGVVPAGVVTVERDDLIADDPRRPVGRRRIDAMGIHVRFGAGDEEGAGEMQPMEAGEIDVTAIHWPCLRRPSAIACSTAHPRRRASAG